MALTSTGSDIAIKRNANGLYDFDWDTAGPNTGNPKFDDTRANAALSQVMQHARGRADGESIEQGGWYWDKAGTMGSLLWTVKNDRLATGSQLESYAEASLQHLVVARMLAAAAAKARRLPSKTGRGRWELELFIAPPSANPGERPDRWVLSI